ncbi:MacS family sensor histidine kinase [Gordonia sp. OPL2]|uniref:MacS family sensor histidine kinase n=1 Tax=Gordonia sp. OPL2 TaxID=2486274 RepID=UPI001655C418|nr:ATP-binding protein [Gordonia sp. OPL2]ROZ99102.1 ATP-binding protein [Gordonia sp. OPL2]
MGGGAQTHSRSSPSRASQIARAADTDPVGPLWRAAQLFRFLSYLYALGFQIAINDDLLHDDAAWVLFGLLTAWSVASGIAYYVGFGRNVYWVVADVVVACALMLTTSYVAETSWALNNQTWPTTLWAVNAVISVALLAGPIWGIVGGLVVGGTSSFVKGAFDLNFGRNATIIIIVATGMAVGLAAVIARRAHAVLTQAAAVAAATEERERLSREVHDGVLQVLSLIAKRGREIGGDTTELAELAGQQERALRRLISDVDDDIDVGTAVVDLAGVLRSFAGEHVSVSSPGVAVGVDVVVAEQLRSVVRNALDNVAHHAGDGAQAFVLLEDLGDRVVVSVRDDGVGIAPGRLDEAQRQGRMGISKSIVGRVEALGGTAVLDSGPGLGTEWELTIPVERQA